MNPVGVTNTKTITSHNGLLSFLVNIHLTMNKKDRAAKLLRIGEELMNKKEYTEGLSLWREAATMGNVDAQYNLGVCYNNGIGVEADNSEAARWWTMAAEQGDITSQYNVGMLYRQGVGVEQDYARSMEWLAKAAKQGDPDAEYELGNFYDNAWGVAQDYHKMMEHYKAAAEKGHPKSQAIVGLFYYENESYAEAAEWLRKSADQGYADGQYYLARCYRYGHGVEQNAEEEAAYFQKAARQGHLDAQVELGDRKSTRLNSSHL